MLADVTPGFIRDRIRASVRVSPGAQLACLQVPPRPSGVILWRPLRTQPRQGRWPQPPHQGRGLAGPREAHEVGAGMCPGRPKGC